MLGVESISQEFTLDFDLLEWNIRLSLPDINIVISSNCSSLLDALHQYFVAWGVEDCPSVPPLKTDSLASTPQHSPAGGTVGTSETGKKQVHVIAIDRPVLDLDAAGLKVDWQDWSREPGKGRRKEAFADITDARLIHKVRTGMVFLQSESVRIAAGPCLQNISQVINFIGSQYMNHLQQQEWLICHAAALSLGDSAVAVAGLSGGGKSTLMLHLMDDERLQFLSNDRLFIRQQGRSVQSRGVPKLPRINPGTLLNNPRLSPLLSAAERQQYERLSTDELWLLEQKHDVDIDQVFGDNRLRQQATLSHFIVLNWSRQSQQQLTIQAVDVSAKPKLLNAIMKSSGPFYQLSNGSFYRNNSGLDRRPYIDILSHVEMIEVSGKIDFMQLKQFCLEHIF